MDSDNNTELWEATGEKLRMLQIRMRKWRWKSHTLRKGDESFENQARRRGRPKPIWKKAVLDEAEKFEKTWSEVKRLAGNRVGRTCFTNVLCS
jgi:hypothetical protein